MIILGEDHLRRILRQYTNYYHHDRTHYSLDKATPLRRPVDPKPSDSAHSVSLPRLGGLHHRCEWRDAA